MRHQTILLIAILLIMLIPVACWDDRTEILRPPRPHPATIQLTAEDIDVTEVVLKIGIEQDRYQRIFTLKRDTTVIVTTTLALTDTVIIDKGRPWGLRPKHNYKYTLIRPLEGEQETRLRREEIKNISITTMDTTSQNFMWDIYTLGDGFSHGFRDVAIINDTCIWAVGEINVKDSLGNWQQPPYNATRWNGKTWELKTILYPYQDSYFYSQLYSVFAFGTDDYWVGSNQPMHWDGRHWRTFDLSGSIWNGWINKIWGTSSSNIYITGDDGATAIFNGTSWQKLESGTTLDITDIWGSTNSKSGKLEIIAVASESYENYERKILSISGTNVKTLSDSGIKTSLTGVWFDAGRKYYVSGDGIFRKRNCFDGGAWSRDVGSSYPYYKNAIRGNGVNDIVVACDRGNILHFNGYSWKSFIAETHLDYGNYYSVAIRGNIIVAVGDNYGRGVIAVGRR